MGLNMIVSRYLQAKMPTSMSMAIQIEHKKRDILPSSLATMHHIHWSNLEPFLRPSHTFCARCPQWNICIPRMRNVDYLNLHLTLGCDSILRMAFYRGMHSQILCQVDNACCKMSSHGHLGFYTFLETLKHFGMSNHLKSLFAEQKWNCGLQVARMAAG